jgi:hypothetical protein
MRALSDIADFWAAGCAIDPPSIPSWAYRCCTVQYSTNTVEHKMHNARAPKGPSAKWVL